MINKYIEAFESKQ